MMAKEESCREAAIAKGVEGSAQQVGTVDILQERQADRAIAWLT